LVACPLLYGILRSSRTPPAMAELARSDTSGLKRSQSSTTLRQTGQLASGTANADGTVAIPKIPRYLSTNGLTTRRKLTASTGNIHGYMAEDYKQLNWPLPKMFGQEKYGFSLIDIDDPRFLKESAANSKKLIRLNYDEQIVDLEWRKTYKALIDAERRLKTVGTCSVMKVDAANIKTKEKIQKEVDAHKKYLSELQEQKDMYQDHVREVYDRCDQIKGQIKKENDLEELRMTLENHTRDKIPRDAGFWKTKFNINSSTQKR